MWRLFRRYIDTPTGDNATFENDRRFYRRIVIVFVYERVPSGMYEIEWILADDIVNENGGQIKKKATQGLGRITEMAHNQINLHSHQTMDMQTKRIKCIVHD